MFGLEGTAVLPHGFQHTDEFRCFCAAINIHERNKSSLPDGPMQASKPASLSWNARFKRSANGKKDVTFKTPKFSQQEFRQLGRPMGLGPGIQQPELKSEDFINRLRSMPGNLHDLKG